VNLTNPMALKGPYRDFFPVGPHTVKLNLPESVEVKRVRLLASDITPSIKNEATTVTVSVPSIRDHEVVAIEI
jgi:hypothetical protein